MSEPFISEAQARAALLRAVEEGTVQLSPEELEKLLQEERNGPAKVARGVGKAISRMFGRPPVQS